MLNRQIINQCTCIMLLNHHNFYLHVLASKLIFTLMERVTNNSPDFLNFRCKNIYYCGPWMSFHSTGDLYKLETHSRAANKWIKNKRDVLKFKNYRISAKFCTRPLADFLISADVFRSPTPRTKTEQNNLISKKCHNSHFRDEQIRFLTLIK